jgi:hypothetical protein
VVLSTFVRLCAHEREHPRDNPCARKTTVVALLSLNLGIVYADILKAGGF